MATNYTLTVDNQSKNYGSVCVYKTAPGQQDNNVSLAWFSKTVHPGTSLVFDWKIDNSKNFTTENAVAEPEANSSGDISPKFFAAFGDFNGGDEIDLSSIENAIELAFNTVDNTLALIIDKDNLISID